MIRFASRALLLVPFLAVVSVLVLAGQGKPALAGAAFVPTRFDDPAPDGCQPSDCSLREAVIAANDTPGGNTITLSGETYTLSLAGALEDAAATGDLDINGGLTIAGAVPIKRSSPRVPSTAHSMSVQPSSRYPISPLWMGA